MIPTEHQEQLKIARQRLATPPPERLRRPEFTGDIVAEFIIPLEMCKPTNRTRGASGWSLGKTKKTLRNLMALQARPRQEPLPGRPQVNAVRFSSVEPDKYADWGKSAIDVLCKPTKRAPNRLNIITDDAPKHTDVNQWWETAPPKQGFVYLQVRTGENQ